MEIAGRKASTEVVTCCRDVERHMRLAISDWYYFLSRLSLSSDTWLYQCDWWMKQAPSQLDVPWAFESLSDSVFRPGMLNILFIKVDEICISIDRIDDDHSIDFPKSMHELRDSLELLKTEVEDAGMAV